MVKFGKEMRVWESLPHNNFVEIGYMDIPLLGKFIPKNTNFGDFGASKPTFLKPQL